jgi:hypothetical protein
MAQDFALACIFACSSYEGDEDCEKSESRRRELGGGSCQVWGARQSGEGNRGRLGREETGLVHFQGAQARAALNTGMRSLYRLTVSVADGWSLYFNV